MLLRKIDGEMNVQNGGFSTKFRNGDGGDMLHDWRLRFYVCLRLRDRDCCSAADGSGSFHAPTPLYFKEITRCRHQNFTGNDQATLTVDWNSAIYFVYVYEIGTNAPAAAPRLMSAFGVAQTARSWRQKHRQERPGPIEISHIRKVLPTKSSKTSRKTSFCCYERRRYWRHCALFFSYYHLQRLFSHLRKIISHQKTEIYIL